MRGSLKILSHLLGGGVQEDYSRAPPVKQIRGWKGPRKPASLPSQACGVGWGVPAAVPPSPMLCLSRRR